MLFTATNFSQVRPNLIIHTKRKRRKLFYVFTINLGNFVVYAWWSWKKSLILLSIVDTVDLNMYIRIVTILNASIEKIENVGGLSR